MLPTQSPSLLTRPNLSLLPSHKSGFITQKCERTHDLVTCLSPSPYLSEVPLSSTPEHKAAESISCNDKAC